MCARHSLRKCQNTQPINIAFPTRLSHRPSRRWNHRPPRRWNHQSDSGAIGKGKCGSSICIRTYVYTWNRKQEIAHKATERCASAQEEQCNPTSGQTLARARTERFRPDASCRNRFFISFPFWLIVNCEKDPGITLSSKKLVNKETRGLTHRQTALINKAYCVKKKRIAASPVTQQFWKYHTTWRCSQFNCLITKTREELLNKFIVKKIIFLYD